MFKMAKLKEIILPSSILMVKTSLLRFKNWNCNHGLFRNPISFFFFSPTSDTRWDPFFFILIRLEGEEREKEKMLRMDNGAVFCAEMMECGNLRNWPSWWWFRPAANGQLFYAERFEITISTATRRSFQLRQLLIGSLLLIQRLVKVRCEQSRFFNPLGSKQTF